MAIIINNLEIENKGSQLKINVQTDSINRITSLLLWTLNDFKDYSKAINLTSRIVGTSNIELITVTATSVGLSKFEDILFLEVVDNVVPNVPGLGVVYNLSPYMGCMMNYLKEYNKDQCTTCNKEVKQEPVILINMMIDSIMKAVDIGYYTQAIEMVNRLKKICSAKPCDGCDSVECTNCTKFTQS